LYALLDEIDTLPMKGALIGSNQRHRSAGRVWRGQLRSQRSTVNSQRSTVHGPAVDSMDRRLPTVAMDCGL
jgi:hypothetical protein